MGWRRWLMLVGSGIVGKTVKWAMLAFSSLVSSFCLIAS